MTTTTLDVVIPVYNEEADLEASVLRVREQLARLPWSHRVTIADNASTDGTAVLARRLAHRYDDVRVVHLAEKGRGRALKRVWADSDADVLVYMDVDLSTDLNALLPLVAPLISGHSDLAIGSRLRHGSRVVRGPKREVISRGYNLLVRGALRTRFSDAQCGFKAIRRDVAREVLPLVEDDAWFFDTELLVLAERAGLRIHEVPVDWVDDPDSRVDIARTAYDDVRGIVRLGRNLVTGRLPLVEVSERLGRASADAGAGRLGMQVAMFGLVGIASTRGVRRQLYLLLRGWTGAWTANALALLLTAIGNTAANRRLTFGVRGRQGRAASPGAGAAGLRDRAGGHQRCAVGGARRGQQPPRGRGGGAHGREPRRHRHAVRGDAGLDVRCAAVTDRHHQQLADLVDHLAVGVAALEPQRASCRRWSRRRGTGTRGRRSASSRRCPGTPTTCHRLGPRPRRNFTASWLPATSSTMVPGRGSLITAKRSSAYDGAGLVSDMLMKVSWGFPADEASGKEEPSTHCLIPRPGRKFPV